MKAVAFSESLSEKHSNASQDAKADTFVSGGAGAADDESSLSLDLDVAKHKSATSSFDFLRASLNKKRRQNSAKNRSENKNKQKSLASKTSASDKKNNAAIDRSEYDKKNVAHDDDDDDVDVDDDDDEVDDRVRQKKLLIAKREDVRRSQDSIHRAIAAGMKDGENGKHVEDDDEDEDDIYNDEKMSTNDSLVEGNSTNAALASVSIETEELDSLHDPFCLTYERNFSAAEQIELNKIRENNKKHWKKVRKIIDNVSASVDVNIQRSVTRAQRAQRHVAVIREWQSPIVMSTEEEEEEGPLPKLRTVKASKSGGGGGGGGGECVDGARIDLRRAFVRKHLLRTWLDVERERRHAVAAATGGIVDNYAERNNNNNNNNDNNDNNDDADGDDDNGAEFVLRDASAALFAAMARYQDVQCDLRTPLNGEAFMRLYCLHVMNHVMKARDRVLRNNAILRDRAQQKKAEKASARAHSSKLQRTAAAAATTTTTTAAAAATATPEAAATVNASLNDLPEVDESLQFKDRGFVTSRVLIVVPHRGAAYKIVQQLLALTPPHMKSEGVIKEHQFEEEYGWIAEDYSDYYVDESVAEEAAAAEASGGVGGGGGAKRGARKRAARRKPLAYVKAFEGNTDDCFRFGVQFLRKNVKLYADYYKADIVIASPLGLRMAAQDESADFLASLQVCVFDQCDALLMQNWAHVEFLLSQLNRTPTKMHNNCDFSRIYEHELNESSVSRRQVLLFSAYGAPEFNALMKRGAGSGAGSDVGGHSASAEATTLAVRANTLNLDNNHLVSACDGNVRGLLRMSRAAPAKGERDDGAIADVVCDAKQFFHRIDADSLAAAAATADVASVDEQRFAYFRDEVFDLFRKARLPNGAVLFIPSYFDFVRVRNLFNREDIECVLLSEYTNDKVARMTLRRFRQGKINTLLTTERYFYYNAPTLLAASFVLFYAPPRNASFYARVVNALTQHSTNVASAHADGQVSTTSAGAAAASAARGASSVGASAVTMYNKIDLLALQRIVGVKRAQIMLKAERSVHMFINK